MFLHKLINHHLNYSDPMANLDQLKDLIASYAATTNKTPFLEHIHYFKNEQGLINRTSIATNWCKLSKESYMKTWIKGLITINGANYVHQQKSPGCPWKYDYASSAELMPDLKHSRDSGIVNADGSINMEQLENVMLASFKYDPEKKCFYVTKSTITQLLVEWCKRDEDQEAKVKFSMPSWEVVAKAEWDDFFLNYVDDWKYNDILCNYEPTVTADTFLQFYFQGKKLYDRVFANELPVPKPV
jgi:hypothetical protein